MPDEEVVVEGDTTENETPVRSAEQIQEEMFEATSRMDTEKFDSLEQEMFSLSNVDESPVQEEVNEEVSTERTTEETPVVQEEVQVVEEPKPEISEAFIEMKRALEEERRKNEVLIAQATAPVPTPAPVAPVSPVMETSKATIPVPPAAPDIPSDPSLWTEDNIKSNAEFQKSRQKYDNEVVSYLTEMSKTTSSLMETEQQRKLREEQDRQKREADSARNGFWDNIRSLQKSIPSMNTGKDIVAVHESIDSFGDNLAVLNGLTPGNTDAQRNAYNQAKQSLVVRYKENDPNVVSRATTAGINKPEGFDTYMAISEVNAFREQMINEGSLGSKSTFRDAYLLKSERDGTLAESYNDIAVREREQTHQDTANKLKESQNAVRTPGSIAPSSAQSTSTPAGITAGIEGLTEDEYRFFENVAADPSYPFSSPERMSYFKGLETKMEKLGY